MREELPPIGDRWGGFGDNADARAPHRGARPARRQPRARTRGPPAADRLPALPRGIRRGEPVRTLHVAHLNSAPPVPAAAVGTRVRERGDIDGILDDAFNDWPVPGSCSRRCSGTCFRLATPTDCWVLVRRLEEEGIYDRALVVVTADHGGSFEAGGSRRYVTAENIADIACVPLFVKYPGRREAGSTAETRGRPTRSDHRRRRRRRLPGRSTAVRSARTGRAWGVSVGRRDGRAHDRRGGVGRSRRARHRAAKRPSVRRRSRLALPDRASSVLLGRAIADVALGRRSRGAARRRIPLRRCPTRFRFRARTDRGRDRGAVPDARGGDRDCRQRAGRGHDADLHAGRRCALRRSCPRPCCARGTTTSRSSGSTLGRPGAAWSARGHRARLHRSSQTGEAGAAERSAPADHRGGSRGAWSRRLSRADVRIQGWAADVDDRQRVDRVLLFAGRRLLFASDTPVYRLDIGGVSSVVGLQHVGFVASSRSATCAG